MKLPTVKDWQDWLDSLSTKGGNILLMFLSVIALMFFMLHVVHDQSDQSLISAAHDMLVGFGAALLAVLSGSSSKQQMTDRIDTARPPESKPEVNVNNAGTINVDSKIPEKTLDNPKRIL